MNYVDNLKELEKKLDEISSYRSKISCRFCVSLVLNMILVIAIFHLYSLMDSHEMILDNHIVLIEELTNRLDNLPETIDYYSEDI